MVDSRETESKEAIRRRRECFACGQRFTTYEMIEQIPITVVKRNGVTELFRVTPDGKEAVRIKVKLGRSSVNVIEVVEGLLVGDRVILSDMAQYDGYDRVRLN